jgi:hypothetical protein
MANTTVVTVVPPLFDEAKVAVAGLPGPILRADQGQLCLRFAAMVHMVRQPLSATLRGPSRSHGAVGAGHRGARGGRLHGGS